MATKDYYLSLNDKQASFAGASSSDIQYNSLNLNHNNERLSQVIKSSKSFTNDSRKEDNYDFTTDSQKEDYFRDKFMKSLPSNFLEQVYPEPKEFGYKEKNSSNSNSSTLSLHIVAYEKFVEGISDPNNSNENVVIKKDKEQKGLIKKLKSTKQLLKDSSSTIKNLFEYPRQQKEENDAIDPEVMQFKASQQLTNPNQSTTNSGLPGLGIAKTMAPNQTERAEIDAMPTAIEKSPTPSSVPVASSSLQPTSAHPHPNEIKIVVLTVELAAARTRTADALHEKATLEALIQTISTKTLVLPTPIPPISPPPRAPYANDIDEIAALEAELKEELERGDIAISDKDKHFKILENIIDQLPPKPQKKVFTYFKK